MAVSFNVNADSGIAKVSHFFKAAVQPGAPEGSAKVKRPNLNFSYQSADKQVPDTAVEDINLILNESLAQFGKRMIAANSSNWDYIPSSESITLAALAAELRKPSERGSGILTAVNLTAIAATYTRWGVDAAGIDASKAQSGGEVLRGQFKSVLGHLPALQVMQNRLNLFADWLSGVDEDTIVSFGLAGNVDLETLAEVTVALGEKLDELIASASKPSVGADDL